MWEEFKVFMFWVLFCFWFFSLVVILLLNRQTFATKVKNPKHIDNQQQTSTAGKKSPTEI